MFRFNIFGFPVTVHWMFWLTAALLGGAANASTQRQLSAVLITVGVIFVSILIHELGHALAMRHFGDRVVEITLYMMGGFARGSSWRSRTEEIIICAAGPAFSALLALLAWLVDRAFPMENGWILFTISRFIWINIAWTIFNLLPIYPLDGGRISMALFGPSRESKALTLSMVTAGILAVWQLSSGSLWNAMLLGSFAVDNYRMLKNQPRIDMMQP